MVKVAFNQQPQTIQMQHRLNLFANLSRRLSVARAQHNAQLITLLEQELQQLEKTWIQSPTSQAGFSPSQLWQRWRKLFALKVEQAVDASGQQWWYGYDPGTGKTIYGETQGDVLRWLEENHLG